MILVNRESKVVVQGITGRQGSFHTQTMLEYGTRVVAGVTPGKGGTTILGTPIYDTVEEAVKRRGADVSIIFVPAAYAKDAALEAVDAGIRLLVVITEHIPIKDSLELLAAARVAGVTVIGPNTPGVITPREAKVGIMPAHIFEPGVVGIVSRSGTLTYEIAWGITRRGLGQTTCLGIGGDPVTGLNFVDALEMFRGDDKTLGVVLVGEIGGNAEELAAEYVSKGYPKPVVAYVAGRSAPPDKRMGHAGAIITGRSGTAESKIKAFAAANVPVAETPSQVAEIMQRNLREYR